MSLDVNISEPDEFNCTELHSCLKEVADLKGIGEFSYHVDYVCGKGENYIANIFKVCIKDNENDDKKLNVMVKTLVNTTRQELFHELHFREVKVYEEILSRYQELQSSLSDDDKLVLPECIYSKKEKGNEIMILEDMNVKGYILDNKLASYENLEFNQVNAVIRELAKLHALSFILERNVDGDFNKIKTDFQDLLFQYNFLNKSKLRHYFSVSFEMTWNLISNCDAKKRLANLKQDIVQILKDYVKPGKRNVLCHGDCWINNILFKYTDTRPPKVTFVDFQVMRYANPTTDILYFLYLCTDAAFRAQHINVLKTTYHNSLKSFLKLYDIDVNLVYTKEDFEKDFEDYLPYGLISALTELRIVTITPEHEKIIKGGDFIPGMEPSEVPGEVEYLKIKVNDVIEESIRNGVLDRLLERKQIYFCGEYVIQDPVSKKPILRTNV